MFSRNKFLYRGTNCIIYVQLHGSCGNGFMQVMLAILIGLLTLLTWHFTRVYTAKSLENLAFGLRYELLQRPILRMWNILNSTVEITTAQVKLSESVIRRYSKPVNQAQQVEVVSFPSHSLFNLILYSGNFFNFFIFSSSMK